MTKDGKEQCKQKVVPTLEEKKDEVVTIPTTPTTPTDTTVFDFCGEEGVLKTFQIVGYLITLIKVLVPLILIIFGSIDFGKAVVASDDKAIQSATRMLVVRAVGGVIIFFIPAIISAATGLISSWAKLETKFKKCDDCLWSRDNCEEHICKSNPDCTWNDTEKECSCVE